MERLKQDRKKFLSVRGFKPCVWATSQPKQWRQNQEGILWPPLATSISRSHCGKGCFCSSPLLPPALPLGLSQPPPHPTPRRAGDTGGREGDQGRERLPGWNLTSLNLRPYTWRRTQLSPACLRHPHSSSRKVASSSAQPLPSLERAPV